ncbi:MAG: hypothetical protein HOP15_17650 [Planctomycetes bacterium]|nr:hypothetical protein [Planctomycetota bacterium]
MSVRSALLLSLAVHVLHVIALPLVITYDGQVYHRLSTLFGSEAFSTEYDTIRTPLFPLLLRAVFWLLGERPESVLLLNAGFSFVAICCASALVRRLAGATAAVLTILLLSFWPLSIAYQHSLLSESATACCLAALALCLFRFLERPSLAACIAAALALSLGYYFRPTLLYFAPCCSLLALGLLWAPHSRASVSLRFAFSTAALLTLVPVALSLPWRALQDRTGRFGYIYAFGIVNQALIDPDDEQELGRLAVPYRDCIAAASIDGRLDYAGLRDVDVTKFLNSLPEETVAAGSAWFWRLVRENPLRYARGVTRSLLLFLGMPALDSENDFLVSSVLSETDEAFLLLHPRYLQDPEWKRLAKPPAPPALRTFGAALAALFSAHVVVLICNGAALALLIFAIVRRDLLTGVVPALVFYSYALHSFTLLSIDRYAFPAYLLLQVAVVLLAARLSARLRPSCRAVSP